MANKKLTELPVAQTLTGNEVMMLVQGGESRQLTLDQVKLLNDPIPGPALGEIRYFKDQPIDASWLKCDGQPHLRTDYPVYEAQRPKPALVVSENTTPGELGKLVWTGTHFVAFERNTGNVYRRTNDSAWQKTVDAVPEQISGISPLSTDENGHCLVIVHGFNRCYCSSDHGLTWTLGGALPGDDTHYSKNWQKPIYLQSFGFITVKNQSNVLAYSLDYGTTWVSLTIPDALAWETLIDAGGPGFVDFLFTSPSSPGMVYEYYGGSVSKYINSPAAGAFNDWIGAFTCATKNRYYTCSVSGLQKQVMLFNSQTWAFNQFLYNLPVVNIISTGELNGRFVALGMMGHLLVVDPNEASIEYIENETSSLNWYGTSASNAVKIIFVSSTTSRMLTVIEDTSRFNAPGLPILADTFPYVYTGA